MTYDPTYHREYRRRNAAHCAAKEKAWREANREHVASLMSAYGREWYAANKERLKPIRRETNRRRLLANPGLMAAYAATRRAQKKRAMPSWANPGLLREAYVAARRLTQDTGEPWHVDHIVPLQHPLVCGLHCESNLNLLPGRLNIAKGNRRWPDMPE